jgi:hypothetical protein
MYSILLSKTMPKQDRPLSALHPAQKQIGASWLRWEQAQFGLHVLLSQSDKSPATRHISLSAI